MAKISLFFHFKPPRVSISAKVWSKTLRLSDLLINLLSNTQVVQFLISRATLFLFENVVIPQPLLPCGILSQTVVSTSWICDILMQWMRWALGTHRPTVPSWSSYLYSSKHWQLQLHIRVWEAEAGGSLSHSDLNREFQARQGCTVRPYFKTTTTTTNKTKNPQCLRSTFNNGPNKSGRRSRHKEMGGYKASWACLLVIPRRTTVCVCLYSMF